MRTPDPIVEEARRAREEYAARFNFDLGVICADLREKARQAGRPLISPPPRSEQAASPLPTPDEPREE